ncbi:P-loop NTPase [Rhodobacteraceae bacterium 2CG4]|uniref:P-loop NTPase n=1 Tax=Halovulum marinum TaxID=2662447 RepID=A0A6L5Z589_9RHOB|nr:P-loop NTPase [Halovulum marinum]MSU91736.1 P-loop NTPase [Halovulum marinum]
MDRVQAAIEKAHLLRERRQKEMKQALREHPPGGDKGFRWKGEPVGNAPAADAAPPLRLATAGARPEAAAGAESRRVAPVPDPVPGGRGESAPGPDAERSRARSSHGPLPQPPRFHLKPPPPGAQPAPADPRASDPQASEPVPAAEESWPMAWDALGAYEPDARLLRANRIVSFERRSVEHAPIDMIRTRMLRIMRENGWRTVVVTSPGPNCGKSTLAANLAFSLAHQPDTRTVLMDLDLRRPSLAKLLGVRGAGSMAEVLTGATPIEDSFLRYGDTLAVSTPGHAAGNPSEVLNSRTAAITMKRVEAILGPEIILCDMPPLMRADDVMAFLPNIDCVLLVAAAEESKMTEIDRCERELGAHTNVLGVVVNKCRYTPEEYGY